MKAGTPNRGACARFGVVAACACVAAIVLLSAACHKKTARARHPRVPASTTASGAELAPGSIEYGYASWYGNPYHGRRTSSGEVYNMYGFTAAHRTLPFGSEVEVTNLENSLRAIVRINDRGPFVDGRIIDLSLAAAKALNVVGSGTATVAVKVLKLGPAAGVAVAEPAMATRAGKGSVSSSEPRSPARAASGRFAAQVGAFAERPNAERICSDLTRRYPEYDVRLVRAPEGRLYRVWIGNEASLQQASAIVERLRHDGITAFAVRQD